MLRIHRYCQPLSKYLYSTNAFIPPIDPSADNNPSLLTQINNTRYSSPLVGHSHVSTPQYVDIKPAPNDDIWIGMSSGVDSSTAAAILAEQYDPHSKVYNPDHGHHLLLDKDAKPASGRVRGIFMANWSSTARCAEADWVDVQRLCDEIGIECHYVNFERQYWTEVFSPMIEMYKQGQTPNPDVGCNRYIKFGELFKHIQAKYKASNDTKKWWLATGHYARIARCVSGPSSSASNIHLLRPHHLPKDQSYYLSSISPQIFDKIYFPLAHYTKPQVREMALNKFHLHTASKPDSQGLCFVGQEGHNTFRKFLDEFVESKPGDVVAMIDYNSRNKINKTNAANSEPNTSVSSTPTERRVVAQHSGIWHATIGQKSGISMPQGSPETQGIWYVHSKNVARNEILIVQGGNHPSLFSKAATCGQFEWLGPVLKVEEVVDSETLDTKTEMQCSKSSLQPQGVHCGNGRVTIMSPTNLYVQYRSLQAPEPVSSITFHKNEKKRSDLKTEGNGENETRIENSSDTYTLSIEFTNPRRAVAPGQYLVLYLGDRVLGSGVIQDTKRVVDI